MLQNYNNLNYFDWKWATNFESNMFKNREFFKSMKLVSTIHKRT